MLQLRERGVDSADALLARPDLQPVLDTLRLLGRLGGSPAGDWVGGSMEVLRGSDFALLAEIGADVRASLGWTALALETYARYPAGKHRILEVMASHGVPLPDSPSMAVHRGRLDLLEQHLRRDPALLVRTFSHEDIYPPHSPATLSRSSRCTARPSPARRSCTWRWITRTSTSRDGCWTTAAT